MWLDNKTADGGWSNTSSFILFLKQISSSLIYNPGRLWEVQMQLDAKERHIYIYSWSKFSFILEYRAKGALFPWKGISEMNYLLSQGLPAPISSRSAPSSLILLHPVLMSIDRTDKWHEVFITAEKESEWAAVPAICTDFKTHRDKIVLHGVSMMNIMPSVPYVFDADNTTEWAGFYSNSRNPHERLKNMATVRFVKEKLIWHLTDSPFCQQPVTANDLVLGCFHYIFHDLTRWWFIFRSSQTEVYGSPS